MALAALLFIRRVSTTTDIAQVTDEFVARTRPDMLQDKEIPPFVAVFRVTGPLLFGSTDKLDVVRDRLDGLPPIVILRLRYMTAIDATGLRAIEDLAHAVQSTSRVFLVSGAREQPLALMRRSHFERRLGAQHMCPTFDDALARAREIHAQRFSGAWPNVAAPIPLPVDTRPESGDEAPAPATWRHADAISPPARRRPDRCASPGEPGRTLAQTAMSASRATAPARLTGSCGCDPEQQRRREPPARHGQADRRRPRRSPAAARSPRRAGARCRRRVAPSAIRMPISAGAARDGIGDQAVEPDHRQQRRHDAEAAGERGQQPVLHERVANHGRHDRVAGPRCADRRLASAAVMAGATEASACRERTTTRARCEPTALLRRGVVDDRPGIVLQRGVGRAADDADDLERLLRTARRRFAREAPADRRLGSAELRREHVRRRWPRASTRGRRAHRSRGRPAAVSPSSRNTRARRVLFDMLNRRSGARLPARRRCRRNRR